MPDTGYQMPDTGGRRPDTRCRIPEAGGRIPDARCRMPDAGCRMSSEALFRPFLRCRAGEAVPALSPLPAIAGNRPAADDAAALHETIGFRACITHRILEEWADGELYDERIQFLADGSYRKDEEYRPPEQHPPQQTPQA